MNAPLLDRLRNHLRQLPDHARNREGGRLLAECLAVLEELVSIVEEAAPGVLDDAAAARGEVRA